MMRTNITTESRRLIVRPPIETAGRIACLHPHRAQRCTIHLLHLLPPEATSPALPGPEGFVHLCWAPQVTDVVKRHFGGGPATALVLDQAALNATLLKEEDTYGHGAYPHYYGELSLDWVQARHVITADSNRLYVDGAPASSDWR